VQVPQQLKGCLYLAEYNWITTLVGVTLQHLAKINLFQNLEFFFATVVAVLKDGRTVQVKIQQALANGILARRSHGKMMKDCRSLVGTIASLIDVTTKSAMLIQSTLLCYCGMSFPPPQQDLGKNRTSFPRFYSPFALTMYCLSVAYGSLLVDYRYQVH
jgi:hypothetical protein